MKRLYRAFLNSARAWRRLIGSEAAFQQEIFLLLLALPIAGFIADGWRGYAVLIVSILALIVVEILNTGIEAACDAVSREFNEDIQLAKDCGSLAVLFTLVIVIIVWGLALAERFGIMFA